MAHDVFISYASGDKVVANAVCAQLESTHRIRCWIAPRDITPGASWAESIIDALDSAKIMVLIFSNSANASMQIEREVERAVHKGINIIPLRIEDATPTKTLEYFISAPHWLDALSVPLEQHIERLASSVKSLLAKSGDGGRLAAPAPSPVPAAGFKLPPARVVESSPTSKRFQNWFVPVTVGALVALLTVAVASRFLPGRSASQQESSAPAPSSGQVVAAAAGASIAPEPDARGESSAPTSPPVAPSIGSEPPASPPVAPKIASGQPAAAVPARPAKARPNLYIDFVNPISEGTILVNVDGRQRWSASLAPSPVPSESDSSASGKRGQPTRTFSQALTLPNGPRKVDVLLLHADGRTREAKALDVTVDETTPQTLRIRLSRFKRDLELTTVAGAPQTDLSAPDTTKVPDAKKPSAVKKPEPDGKKQT